MVSFMCGSIGIAIVMFGIQAVRTIEHHRPPPSFIAGANKEALEKFEEIREDNTMSKPTKEEAVQKLVNSLGGDFPSKYKMWTANKTAELRKRINTILVDEDEKTAYFTREKIQANSALGQEEKKAKLIALLSPLAPDIRFHILKVRKNPSDWDRISCRDCGEEVVINLLTEDDYFWNEATFARRKFYDWPLEGTCDNMFVF